MKSFLFILTLLFGILLFVPEEGKSNDTVLDMSEQKEAVMKEKNAADMQHHLEVLSNDLKEVNCLTPRRAMQSTGNSTFNIRLLKIEEKVHQYFHLKKENLLLKISEEVTTYQTINISTLLCRTGYHIYALRKIII